MIRYFCCGDIVRLTRPERGTLLRYLYEHTGNLYLATDVPKTIPDPERPMPSGFGIRIYNKSDVDIHFVGRPDSLGNIVLGKPTDNTTHEEFVHTAEYRLGLIRNGMPHRQKIYEAVELIDLLDHARTSYASEADHYFAEFDEVAPAIFGEAAASFLERARQAQI